MSASVATLRDVSHRYPDSTEQSIQHASWDIGHGDFLLVAGQSGSGKSTLLRTLNGLVPHFSGGHFAGTVEINGLSTRRNGPNRLGQHVGFVFQDPEAQLLASRVDDDIAFSLEQSGTAVGIMRKRVEELLDLLGIAHLRHRTPATLSSGERQRVAIAGAMALHPSLLVLDEPTSQLDPWGAEDVLAALSRMNDDLGLTVVIAEHRMERLLHRVDGVRWIAEGLSNDATVAPEAFARTTDPIVLPSVSRIGVALGWEPIPLTVKDGRKRANGSVAMTHTPDRSRTSNPGRKIISCRSADIRHGRRTVLQNVDVHVSEGEIVALVGRNGSGKTTLLRTLAGHHPADGGEIEVGDVIVKDTPPGDIGRIVGYLPHRPASMLFTEHVEDEILYTARQRGVTVNVAKQLERVGLAGSEGRHPRDLSGGEQERLALAIMLTGTPAALLLDEPTRGMDAWRKADLIAILAAYRDRGGAVLLATHDVDLVAEIADRVVMLGDREIIADGSPESLLGGSLTFTTQTQLMFGDRWLTPASVITAQGGTPPEDRET